jgi:hypothetical protein
LILHLLRDWPIFNQFGTSFDLGLRQRNNEFLLFEILSRNGRWMDEHLAPSQPSPAISDEPAHFPRPIVKQKIDDIPDSAIACLDREALQRGNDLQHSLAPYVNQQERHLAASSDERAIFDRGATYSSQSGA